MPQGEIVELETLVPGNLEGTKVFPSRHPPGFLTKKIQIICGGEQLQFKFNQICADNRKSPNNTMNKSQQKQQTPDL